MALTSTTCWTADRAATPYDALYGERGRDTAVYADAPGGLIADLANSTHDTGEARDDSNLSIENLFGCAFGDVLRGDEGDNLLQGLGGMIP
ncbi:hypothetical protein SAMN05216376_107174 [Mameliella alba]|uniref:hypothetical protein n=1 Tax=Mameliella alba TaxID=561184 RepID=UPI00088B38C4|nr:hypothetical protein [Mameliella alba]OWV48708.1 hypothetical protein CDZ96_08890 [Mameliella alba]PTR39273.1 hypothetical protein LX94_02451 [Mameliella alba]GGF64570.1 hypothetical protein GCM10011319_27010 [Mameliella alba]SDD29043.1 hypothetical protein SAMN05216376_107174 [Mameliella alba]